MRPSPARASAAALVLALLLVLLGFPGSPAHAAPPDFPPLPDTGAAPGEGWEYTYDSVAYWERELTFTPGASPERDAVSWFGETYDMRAIALLDQRESDPPGADDPRSPKGKYLVGTIEHVLTRFLRHIEGEDMAGWPDLTPEARQSEFWRWLRFEYIAMMDRRSQGKAFEDLLDSLFKLGERGFRRNRKFPGREFYGDFHWEEDKFVQLAIEAKAGDTFPTDQAANYKSMAAEGTRVVYISGMPFDEKKRTSLVNRGFEVYHVPTVPKPLRHRNYRPPPGAGPEMAPGTPLLKPGPTGALNDGGRSTSEAPSSDALGSSPDSPEQAAGEARQAEEFAREFGEESAADSDMTADPLGGVDFSTLELRYVSDTYDSGLGSGVDYAYQVEADPDRPVSFGGRESAKLAADSFFTWLALPPELFTVNLNPDEPDRVIDATLGTTDAGRVLLEADLRMKKTVGELIHPDTKLGAEFWDALRGDGKCLSLREWIVPKPAVVREEGNALHILEAPLEVKMETQYLQAKGAGGTSGCPGQSEADTAYNESVDRRMILPELEKAINEAPEYADLRRVYASRVAAEWYRQRSKTKTTAYSSIIDSGDVSKWPLRVKWTPRDTFDAYVESYKEGEFTVKRTTRQGNQIITHLYVYGGVNFSQIPSSDVGERDFAARHPERGAAVSGSLDAPTAEPGTNTLWLGGRTTERPLWNPIPPPASVLRNPLFYALTALPVVSWLLLGFFLWRRRNRKATAPAVTTGQVTP